VFHLTDEDYLFLFDYSCSNFGKASIIQDSSLRTLRSLGRSVTSDLGFGLRKSSTKRRAKPKPLRKKRTKSKKSKV
jgi:hypothetical protein